MKTTALLVPTYRRFSDLINTLENTPIDVRTKFVIVANLQDDELAYIKEKYGDKSIIVDEREYGKLGGCKAYNLAFKIAKENNFDYAILYADDIIPFKSNWLNKVYKEFINKNGKFGIFSTDESHPGHYGWNLVLDCPIAHFFIIDCNIVDQLFSDEYKQYAIDFEIAVRLKESGIDIQLLPIKLNHLRSGLHREFMDKTMNEDINTLIMAHPKYESSFKQQLNLHFLEHSSKSKFLSQINVDKLPFWTELKPKEKFKHSVKRGIKHKINGVLNSFGYSIRKNQKEDPEADELRDFIYRNHWLKDFNIHTILDVGANEGQFAKKITALLPSARLYCFEPLHEPFMKLEKHFHLNENVILHQFALGDVEQDLAINLNEYSPSSSFLKMDENHKVNFNHAIETAKCNVHIKRLDSVDLNLIEPILIKIDVQGFEDKVIAGGTDIIKKAKIIIIEVSFKELYENQPLFDNLYHTLRKLGFSYRGNFEQLTSPVTSEILQADAIFIK